MLLKDDNDRIGYQSGGYNIQSEFIDSNDNFVTRMAKMSMEDTKRTKDRDKAVEAYIQDKVKVAKTLGLEDFTKEYYKNQIAEAMRKMAKDKNPLLETRQVRAKGGLLGDLDKDGTLSGYEKARQDAIEENMRDQKAVGGIASRLASLLSRKSKLEKELITENMSKANQTKTSKEINRLQKEIDEGVSSEAAADLQREMSEVANKLKARGFSDDRIDELLEEAFENRNYSELEEALSRTPKQEGGEMDNQMMMIMSKPTETEVEPDGEMEENYTDFIMSEALTEEEEDMLTQKLEQDEQLAMLFDKVIDVAQEFAGSGPVEGPGSGVSDSIPARLSDGEFVFTAKAVEEIGADELMRMMKDAEMKADERQQAYDGGLMNGELEKVVQTETRITKPADTTSPALGATEDNLIQEEVTRNMLDPRVQHVRS